jgi:hypothetical protein
VKGDGEIPRTLATDHAPERADRQPANQPNQNPSHAPCAKSRGACARFMPVLNWEWRVDFPRSRRAEVAQISVYPRIAAETVNPTFAPESTLFVSAKWSSRVEFVVGICPHHPSAKFADYFKDF